MSRTVKDISQEIKEAFIANITLQEAYGLLPDKSFDDQFATSSIEAVLINIVASVIWLHESLWELFRKEMETLIDNSYVTSRPWYYQRALEFQNGDTLSFDESTYSFRYPTVDESKRIVKNVAIREVTDNNVTKLKIYFSDERKQPLTGDVRTAFEDYMRQIGAAVRTTCLSARSPMSCVFTCIFITIRLFSIRRVNVWLQEGSLWRRPLRIIWIHWNMEGCFTPPGWSICCKLRKA